jgi:hypothetical protein
MNRFTLCPKCKGLGTILKETSGEKKVYLNDGTYIYEPYTESRPFDCPKCKGTGFA